MTTTISNFVNCYQNKDDATVTIIRTQEKTPIYSGDVCSIPTAIGNIEIITFAENHTPNTIITINDKSTKIVARCFCNLDNCL